jgi:hypothetical protein
MSDIYNTGEQPCLSCKYIKRVSALPTLQDSKVGPDHLFMKKTRIGGVVKKVSFSMVERGLVKKVSFSSLERSVVKKSFSVWLDKKKVQKIVK